MFNGCGTRVYYYWNGTKNDGCISHNSTRARSGDFPDITFFYVDVVANC
jgi:hypothetical protein